jgi:hypothetical protein
VRKLLRAVFGSLTTRRERIVNSELARFHALEVPVLAPACDAETCQAHHDHVDELSRRMHEQSHRLHVLQWKNARFAAKVTGEEPEDPVVVPFRTARQQ